MYILRVLYTWSESLFSLHFPSTENKYNNNIYTKLKWVEKGKVVSIRTVMLNMSRYDSCIWTLTSSHYFNNSFCMGFFYIFDLKENLFDIFTLEELCSRQLLTQYSTQMCLYHFCVMNWCIVAISVTLVSL